MKPFDEELVSGSLLRSVWKLAWPVTLLNLMNGLHGFIDHVLVGHYMQSDTNAANAAIGVAWQIFLVVVVFISSLFLGMNVLISRYTGKQDRERVSEVAFQAFLTSVYILLFILAPMGYFIAPWLLHFMPGEPAVKEIALPYLRILFTCCTPLFLLFMVVGAFQSSGDAKIPLFLGVFNSLLHTAISSSLIIGLGPLPSLGANGAAIGTVGAPAVTVLLALLLVVSGKTIIKVPEKITFKPDVDMLRAIIRIGLPSGIQGVLLNLGGVFLLVFVGTLPHSDAAQAAYTICYAQLFSLVTWTSFGLRNASAALIGQNIGAGKRERGKQAVALTAFIGFLWAGVIGLMFWAIPEQLLGLFNATHEPIRSYGISLLHWLAFSGIVLAPALALTGGIQGAGATKSPMYIAFATQIVLLLGLCGAFYYTNTLTPEKVWLSIFVCHAARMALTWAVFRTEAWTHTNIELAQERS